MIVSSLDLRACFQEILQVASSCVENIFLADSWLALLSKENPDASRNMILDLCKGFLQMHDVYVEIFQAWQAESDLLQEVEQALRNCFAVARGLLALMAADEDDAQVQMSGLQGAQAVLAIAEYKGKGVMLRTYRSILQQPFWQGLVRDVTRTAGSCEALKPKVDELNNLLTKLELNTPRAASADDLGIMWQLLTDLKDGLRESRMKALEARCLAIASSCAKYLVGTQGQGVSQQMLQVTQALLQAFSDQPGVLSVMKEFEEWTVTVQAQLTATQFLKVLRSTEGGIDFDGVATLLPKDRACWGGSGGDELVEASAHFLAAALQFFLDKAHSP